MRIADDKIEEVRVTADIVDVVSDYVRLKRSGSRYKGLCPFHDENTPSFSVDPGQNLFYCFGCQKGGDLFTFVQEMEGVTFIETVRMLAERYGIPLPEEEGDAEAHSEVESVYHALRFAANFFYEQLTQTETGRPALQYLKERGFQKQIVKDFGLGYAPDRWDGLLKAAEDESVDAEVLEKAGLAIPRKSSDGHYDRFRGRVMFPILSHVGKVLGFGGRILDEDADQPKYINTPETKVYNKRRVLYGLHQAKQAIRKQEEVLLVEGYTDVAALHQAGVENAVATSGTSLTKDQIKLLGRYAERILLLYDADEAGANAALRGINLILEQGLAAYVVALPGGDDPDSYVQQHGGDAFQEYVAEERQDFTAFMHAQARRAGRLDTPEGEAQVMRSVVASVAEIPDPLMRETYLRRASDVLGVPDIRLYEVLRGIREEKSRKSQRKQQRRAVRSLSSEKPTTREQASEAADSQGNPSEREETDQHPAPLPPEKMLHRLMLERGAPLVEFILGHMAMDEFTEGPSRRMAETFLEMYEDDRVDKNRFLSGELGESIQQLASEVMMDEYEASEGWQQRSITVPALNEAPYESAASAMTLLKRRRVQGAIEEQQEAIYRIRQQEDDQALQQEMRKLQKLHGLRKHIEERAFLDQDTA